MLVFFSGLMIFLAGLEGCKWSIKKVLSHRFKKLLISLNDHMFLSMMIGILITAILQSSSAVTIILISLIEAKALSLRTAICIIMGANIGTTFTVQIISFPILNYYPYLIIIGITVIIISNLCNKRKFLYFGSMIVFFAVVFAGLVLMTVYFKLADNRIFVKEILKFSNTNIYLGILLGAVATAIIQSSSAVTGIIVSLAFNNLISLSVAIAIALGSNIGTCITAFLASFNAGTISKMMAKGHFLFNIVGVIVLLPFFTIFEKIVSMTSIELVRQIANAHTIFNIFNVLIFIPFLNTFISWIGGDNIGYD